jgi:predicted MFS family arabinose efflux permease
VATLLLVRAAIPRRDHRGPPGDRDGTAAVLWRTPAASMPVRVRRAWPKAAVLLGLAYALCLVSGLRQAEHMASPDERGAVIACYYAVAYLGFAVPYLVDGLGAVSGRTGAFGLLTAIIAVLALWTTGYAIRSSLASPPTPESESARGEGRPVPQ